MTLTSFTALSMGSLQFNAAKEIPFSMSKQSKEGYDLKNFVETKKLTNIDTKNERFG